VAARVQSRVGEHGNAVEHDPVEQGGAGNVAPAAALARFTVLIMKEHTAVFHRVGHRRYRLIGADHGAHAAADAAMFHIGALAYPDKSAVVVAPFVGQHLQLRNTLPAVAQVEALLGTYRGALAAQGAPVLPVLDDPGAVEICQAARGNGN
jgi:hypothetical protein